VAAVPRRVSPHDTIGLGDEKHVALLLFSHPGDPRGGMRCRHDSRPVLAAFETAVLLLYSSRQSRFDCAR